MFDNVPDGCVALIRRITVVHAVFLSKCCDLHAVLCQSSCNAVGLDVVTTLEQQYDAVLNQSLYVSAVPYNVDDASLLLVPICCML